MPPPYDQGQLGSCTANAIAGALEFDQIKQSLKEFTPSRLFIYYNERVIEHTVGTDSGAQIRDGIKSVGKMETPELNDEWAKSLDEGYESLTDLRKKLRTDLETYAKTDADARLRNNAVAKLIEENTFEVPNTLIESQSRNLLNNFARDLQGRGVDLNNVQNDFVRMAYEQMRTQAERDVRGAILLEKIADAEKIEVTDGELDDEIGKMAEYYHVTPEHIRESMEKQNAIAEVRNNLKTRKAIEALIDKAKIKDGPWVDEHAEKAAEEKAADGEKKALKKMVKAEGKSADKPAEKAEKAEKKETKRKTAKSQ